MVRRSKMSVRFFSLGCVLIATCLIAVLCAPNRTSGGVVDGHGGSVGDSPDGKPHTNAFDPVNGSVNGGGKRLLTIKSPAFTPPRTEFSSRGTPTKRPIFR
jgi:hypothetical protein